MSPIATPFGFHSTAAEVVAGIDLSEKKILVTGAGSGIGLATARALASVGAHVVLGVRDMVHGNSVADEIRQSTDNENVEAKFIELTEFASINSFSVRWEGPLHVLVLNAGVMAMPEERTEHGYEMQFATNYLGHFALAQRMHDAMRLAQGARVVSVSDRAHMLSPVVFDDLHFKFREYDPWLAYAQSKTANILFAVEATKRWRDHGIVANAVNPGLSQTHLQRYVGGQMHIPEDKQKNPEQAAAGSVLLATSSTLEGIGGKYFENCNEAEMAFERDEDMTGVAPFAINAQNAERLWEMSTQLIR